MEFVLIFSGAYLAALALQYFFGCRCQYHVLRYIPLYAAAVLIIYSIYILNSPPGMFDFRGLVAGFFLLLAACLILGHITAHIIHFLRRRKNAKNQTANDRK